MKATVVELRYKMKEVLKALEQRENVTILYHGKVKGTIIPAKRNSTKKVEEHPFFGMNRDDSASVLEKMDKLRGPRFDAF
jgi:antitoxin (DNA-binding transcriptional repressor) of toxin-antitoxin stability system